MKNELLIYGLDTPENIAKCLNCTKVRCNNCLTGRSCKPRRTVLQCDIRTGKIVTAFSSVMAAAKAMNLTPNTLYRCLNGQIKTAGGYVWKYEKED